MTTYKYLFGYGGTSANLNTIDSGMYEVAIYAPNETSPMFNLDTPFNEKVYQVNGQMTFEVERGNQPAENIPLGPCAIPNLIWIYWMHGSYDLSANQIQFPTYGTAKVNFDLYEEITDDGTELAMYLLGAILSDLHIEFQKETGWIQSGSAIGLGHGAYVDTDNGGAATPVVNNGLPDDSNDDAVSAPFDTLKTVVWNATTIYPDILSVDWSQTVPGYFGSDGKYTSLYTNASIKGAVNIQMLGFQSAMLADYIAGTARTMTFTMGKSTTDHAAAFTLTGCKIFAYQKNKGLGDRIVTNWMILFEDSKIVESGTLPIVEATFYPTNVA